MQIKPASVRVPYAAYLPSQGHANMLKALLQHLDSIPDDMVTGMSIPRATPMVYDLGEDMIPLRPRDATTGISAELLSVDESEARLQSATGEVNDF